MPRAPIPHTHFNQVFFLFVLGFPLHYYLHAVQTTYTHRLPRSLAFNAQCHYFLPGFFLSCGLAKKKEATLAE